MTDPKMEAFLAGDMTPEEEEAFLEERPELRQSLDVHRWLDGECNDDDADTMRALALGNPKLEDDMHAVLQIDALATAAPPVATEKEPAREKRSRRPPRWAKRAGWAAAATGLAALFIIAVIPSPSEDLPLSITVVSGANVRAAGNTSAAPGDTLRIQISTHDSPHVALRIYRQGTGLVLQCPDAPACVVREGTVRIDHPVEERGTYHILRVASEEPIPPSRGNMNQDLEALDTSALELKTVRVL